MKIYKGDMTIECSAEEFVKIKDVLLDIEEENSVKLEVPLQVPLFDNFEGDIRYFNRMIDKIYPPLDGSQNYD